ncbi:MAG: DUF2207 domain-containing protein [Sphaerochaetaceae bacterium]|nr:DUF2207 domain-containing protein [Sphaerochaetaceae bacterium]
MKKTRLLCTVLLLFCAVSLISASESIFDVKEAEINVSVGKNAVHTIEENYLFYYNVPSHGFYRDIPTDYSQWKVRARVKNIQCSDPFSVETDGSYVSLKIGESDTVIRGYKEYSLSYTYDLGADGNEGYDEFYLNLIGSSWDSPFEKVSFTVTVPYTGSDMRVCLTDGSYGSQSYSGSFETYKSGNNTIIKGTTENLRPGESLTVRIELPDSWYVGAREVKDNRAQASLIVCAVSVLVTLLAALLWTKFGRDKTPIITARFEAPDNFTPLATGYVADGTVDDKDITSMIYYWADKGYLRIEEKKKDKFEFVRMVTELPQSCLYYERRLFSALFRKADEEGRVTLKDLQRSNFFQDMQNAREDVTRFFTKENRLTDMKSEIMQIVFSLASFLPGFLAVVAVSQYEFVSEGVFILAFGAFITPLVMLLLFYRLFKKWYLRKTNLPIEIFIIALTASIIVIRYAITSVFYENCPLYFPLVTVLSTVVTAFFSSIMLRRSEYGQKVFEEILGYREFIDKVETDKLKTMIESDPDLYYHVLSYAIVFGLENKWSKKFSSLNTAQPSWYTGISPVDVMLYSAMSSRLNNAIRLNAMSSAQFRSGGIPKMGGGGFHSGGFSGGGFGGGGGHAW